MNARLLLACISALAVTIASSASLLHAQTIDDYPLSSVGTTPASDITAFTNTQTNLSIQTFPQYPRPGDAVVAKVSGLITNLSNDTITWFLDGSPITQGPGKTTATFTAGSIGHISQLTAQATDPTTGAVFSAYANVSPSTVDLVWETDTYTPPFYRGKALQTAGSKVRLTAFPVILDAFGNPIPASDLVYTWRQGTTVMPDLSGRGRQSVVMSNNNVIGPLVASVTVAAADDSSVGGSASINLQVSNPEIVFYQDHPLMGILYAHALPETTPLSSEEMQLVAEPYFFSATTRNADNLEYTWLINGRQSSDLANTGSAIVLKGTAGSKAAASVDVRVRNTDVYMQSTRGTITVQSSPAQ